MNQIEHDNSPYIPSPPCVRETVDGERTCAPRPSSRTPAPLAGLETASAFIARRDLAAVVSVLVMEHEGDFGFSDRCLDGHEDRDSPRSVGSSAPARSKAPWPVPRASGWPGSWLRTRHRPAGPRTRHGHRSAVPLLLGAGWRGEVGSLRVAALRQSSVALAVSVMPACSGDHTLGEAGESPRLTIRGLCRSSRP